MEIKATTIEDFEEQYYSEKQDSPLNEILINLTTNDAFWKLISEEQVSRQMLDITQLTGIAHQGNTRVKSFYHPEYGQIDMIEKL